MEEQVLDLALKYLGSTGMMIAMMLGTLVIVAQAVVVMTPSHKDDEAWEKILNIPVLGNLLKALSKLAPIQKK